MNAADFVRHVQRQLLVTAILNVVVIAAAIALAVFGIAAFIGFPIAAPLVVSISLVASFVLYAAWRARPLRSVQQTALWIEELVPLQYALVTASEGTFSRPQIEASINPDAIRPVVTRRVMKFSLRTFAALTAALTLYLVSPATSFGRGRVHSGLSRVFPSVVAPVDKLAGTRVRAIPPAYSHAASFERVNAASVTALIGSRVLVSGNGSPEGVSVLLDNSSAHIAGDADSWTAEFVARKPVTVVHIAYQSRDRVIVIETTPDNAPHVVLNAPVRDSTLRSPNFSVRLSASADDDIGLADGYFEYLIVSGSGEAFTGRTVTSAPRHFDTRSGSMEARLDFAGQKIVAGDLVSIRAIARDNNTVTGPSIGTSDTRTFRVARADEYDSVSIEAAAPAPIDSSAMSQRMLIIMTEALVKKKKTLNRRQLVKESDDIGFMEDRIRKRVYDILYQTDSPEGAGDTEEAESELQAINNPDMKQAYDALWDAVRSLRIAEPAAALPPMRLALKALDRARLAKRLYLRGASPKVVVDVGHVRLTGKEHGASSIRTPQFAPDSSRRFFAAEFQAALAKLKTDSRSAIEDLSLLRARALEASPDFASALKESIDLLQQHRSADRALSRARKALQSSNTSRQTSVDWGGGE